jgi:large subunit ribosomal protein L3
VQLKVIKVDRKLNLIYVKGAVPGHTGQYIKVRDAQCNGKVFPESVSPPFPTLSASDLERLPEEMVLKAKQDMFLTKE